MNRDLQAAIADTEICRVNAEAALARLETLPVFYLDLSLIMDQSQASSPAHAERVQLICERQISRLAPHELLLFEGGGFFIVIQTRTGDAAQALINEINVALLKHFFGTDSFTPEQLGSFFHVTTPAEAKRVANMPALERHFGVNSATSASAVTDKAQVEPGLAARSNAASTSHSVGIELEFVPVCDLRKDAATTFFCAASKRSGESVLFESAALSGFDPRERPHLDISMLNRSLAFLRETAEIGMLCGAGASVSFETLAWSRGRQLYQQALRASDVANNPFLVIKICDVPPGTPENRLAEVVGTIRPLVKRLFVQIPIEDLPCHLCGYLGVTGLVAALPAHATPVTTSRITNALVRAATEQRALASIDGVDRSDCIGIVRAAGARFATGSAFDSVYFPPEIQLDKFRQQWSQ